jgi:hypothetical protein
MASMCDGIPYLVECLVFCGGVSGKYFVSLVIGGVQVSEGGSEVAFDGLRDVFVSLDSFVGSGAIGAILLSPGSGKRIEIGLEFAQVLLNAEVIESDGGVAIEVLGTVMPKLPTLSVSGEGGYKFFKLNVSRSSFVVLNECLSIFSNSHLYIIEPIDLFGELAEVWGECRLSVTLVEGIANTLAGFLLSGIDGGSASEVGRLLIVEFSKGDEGVLNAGREKAQVVIAISVLQMLLKYWLDMGNFIVHVLVEVGESRTFLFSCKRIFEPLITSCFILLLDAFVVFIDGLTDLLSQFFPRLGMLCGMSSLSGSLTSRVTCLLLALRSAALVLALVMLASP